MYFLLTPMSWIPIPHIFCEFYDDVLMSCNQNHVSPAENESNENVLA